MTAESPVKLHPHGLDLGDGKILPLRAGAMHYFRHDPSRLGGGSRCDRVHQAGARRRVCAVGAA
jgi:hypothetical protein